MINIVDYIGYCDKNKKPVGHSLKTINEFSGLLKNKFVIKLTIPKIYKDYVTSNLKNVKYLDIDNSKIMNNKKVGHLFYILKKIFLVQKIIRSKNAEKIWFINTDFWFFFSLLFLTKTNKQIIATNYINYDLTDTFKNRFKKFVFQKSISKVTKIITTNSKIKDHKYEYIPDYFYDENEYLEFIQTPKENVTVCLGSMNEAKDVKNLVHVFNKNHQKLIIIGKFSSENLFDELIKIKKDNIQIENRFLTKKEYYTLLGKAKYAVLPYIEENYSSRSSGVILESVFLKTHVIAPSFLLEHCNIHGSGYEDIFYLKGFKEISDVDIRKSNEKNFRMISSTYNKAQVAKKLSKIFVE